MNEDQAIRNDIRLNDFIAREQRVRQLDRAPLVMRRPVHAGEGQRRRRIISKGELHPPDEPDRIIFSFDPINHIQRLLAQTIIRDNRFSSGAQIDIALDA
jgi:hypothetical protein